jgi:formylglycine-generating enzyme required for sulfatase activity
MSLEAACSFDPASSAKDELPANCLDHALAQEICAALDKRLPSEAEWEWAAGNRTQETTYPWGDDGDTVCDDAVIGRGRSPAEVSVAVIESDACRGLAGGEGVPWGPVSDPAGRDVAELGIHHLAGNVAEYTSDLFAAYDDTCWRPEERLLVDPHCVIAAGNIAPVSVRGGGWSGLRVQARVYERDAAASGATPPNTGVRCALSLAP